MAIVPTIRKMLLAVDPAKANVPIWITEENVGVGTVEGTVAETVTSQAWDLVKGYSMSLAEGITRTSFYQPEDQGDGYGLLDSSGNPNPAYDALENLTANLGTNPQYRGWVQLHANQDYGFVFQGANTSVMALWTAAGVTENISFSSNVQVLDPITGTVTNLSAGNAMPLTGAPVLILGVPANLVTQSQADVSQPFPWGGNYRGANVVSLTAGEPNSDSGLHQMFADGSSEFVGTINGQPARDCSQGFSGSAQIMQEFTVDPNFLSYTHVPVTISATVCLKPGAPGGTSLNLVYEGVGGWESTGWTTVPGGTAWTTLTWSIPDTEFDGVSGFNFDLYSPSTAANQYYLAKVSVTNQSSGTQQVSMAPNFNAPAAFTDGTTFASNGGLDAAGDAYSATLLGSSVTSQGTKFAVGPANHNNVVNATGQTVTLTSGKFSALTFLGAATGGSQTGTFTVNYSDGTHQTFTQAMSDWLSGSTAVGEVVASAMSYYNMYNGTSPTYTTYLYQYTFELNAAKTVSGIVLPRNTSIHLLAVDLLP
jgi:hypothetical protein